MANYIVDIAVALKGSEKVTKFNKQLETTSKQIQSLNKFIQDFEKEAGDLVKSFDNLSSNLAKAKSNFNAVASGTRMQEKAARQLIKAEKELNKELEERDKLLSKLRGTGKMNLPGTGVGRDPVASSIERRRRKLMKGANQYSSAIGPVSPFPNTGLVTGARSSIAEDGTGALLGQSVNIEKSLKERMAIQDKLFQMEIGQTEAAKERTKELNRQNTELRRMKVENKQSLYANTFTQYAGPIGPGMASPINPQAIINERIEEQKRIQRRQDRLLRVQRGRDLQSRMQQAQSNALIGGAFPLLFGQGLGASIGGATGGAAGGAKGGQFGFALSLVGTVVGAQFDKLAQSARELGEALRNPIKNMDMLITKMGQANTPFADTVNTLKEFGLEAVAAGVVLDNFNKTFGTNKTTISQLGEESIRFTNELTKLGTGISLFVAGPLTFFLEKINAALGFQTVDEIRDKARGQAIKEKRVELGILRPDGSRGLGFAFKQLFEPTIRNMPDVKQRSFELFEQEMNKAGLGGQEGTRDFSNENLQRLIKERRDFELSTMRDQLFIQQQSLTMSSEDLDVLKRRTDLLKIEDKLKVKGLVDTKIMTDEQKKAHEFAIQKLEIERDISQELLNQAIIMADPMQAALIDLNKQMEKFEDLRYQTVEFAKAFGSAFEESFKGIVKGTMSVQEAFRNMFMRIADHFLDMAAQMMAAQISKGIIGFIGNIFGGGTTNDVFAGFNQGPAGEVTMADFGGPLASGGMTKAGKSYLVGERGPELFTPGVSGMVTPNDALGGSTNNIVVNVDATGSAVEGDEDQGRELGRLISAAVQSEIIQQQRPGGLLA